jgi:ADP-ribose pyrophosphatase YjhB (NUDIX family)
MFREITEADFGLKAREVSEYKVRRAVRGIVVSPKGEIALLYLSAKNYHKVPGGGVDQGESLEDAVRREVAEETGMRVRIERPLGVVIENMTTLAKMQISYLFICRAIGKPGKMRLTKGEVAEGVTWEWVPIVKALKLLSGKANSVEGKFARERELTIVRFAAKALKKRTKE